MHVYPAVRRNANVLRGCFEGTECSALLAARQLGSLVSSNVSLNFRSRARILHICTSFRTPQRVCPLRSECGASVDASTSLLLRKLQCVFNLWLRISAQTVTVISCDGAAAASHIHIFIHYARQLLMLHSACHMAHATRHIPRAMPGPVTRRAIGNLRCACHRPIVIQLTRQLIKLRALKAKQISFFAN